MGRSIEIIEADLGHVNLTYSINRPLFPRVTPAVGKGGVEAKILETTNTLARLLALKTFRIPAPLGLGPVFLGKMIAHQSKVLIDNNSANIGESLLNYYSDLASQIGGL